MRYLLILLLICSCKNQIKVKSEKEIGSTCDKGYTIIVANSNAQEFESTNITKFFEPFTYNNINTLKDNRPFLEVVTISATLKFNNVDPDKDSQYLDEQLVVYHNLGYNDKLNKHLIYEKSYEEGKYLLIDHITAKIDTLNDFPYFSPDREKFVTSYNNPYSDREIDDKVVYVNELDIALNCNGTMKKIYSSSFDFIPTEIKWKDSNTILLKAFNSLDYTKFQSGEISIDTAHTIYKKISLKQYDQ